MCIYIQRYNEIINVETLHILFRKSYMHNSLSSSTKWSVLSKLPNHPLMPLLLQYKASELPKKYIYIPIYKKIIDVFTTYHRIGWQPAQRKSLLWKFAHDSSFGKSSKRLLYSLTFSRLHFHEKCLLQRVFTLISIIISSRLWKLPEAIEALFVSSSFDHLNHSSDATSSYQMAL